MRDAVAAALDSPCRNRERDRTDGPFWTRQAPALLRSPAVATTISASAPPSPPGSTRSTGETEPPAVVSRREPSSARPRVSAVHFTRVPEPNAQSRSEPGSGAAIRTSAGAGTRSSVVPHLQPRTNRVRCPVPKRGMRPRIGDFHRCRRGRESLDWSRGYLRTLPTEHIRSAHNLWSSCPWMLTASPTSCVFW
jgi:hypothetical protein